MKGLFPFIAICLTLFAFSACDKGSVDRLSDEDLAKNVQFSFTVTAVHNFIDELAVIAG